MDIPSVSGDPNLVVSVVFPETNLGDTARVECPCGSLNLSSTLLIGTRVCGGTYENGAIWEVADVSACNFSDTTRELCRLVEVCVLTRDMTMPQTASSKMHV